MAETDSTKEDLELEEDEIPDIVEEPSLENFGKKDKSGVLYIQTVPPLFTVRKIREIMSAYGEVGRIYLQAEKQRSGGKKRKRYTEGWVEFKKKSVAKSVEKILNGAQVGGKRRSMAYDSLWSLKYLNRFKWAHLMEQLTYERRVEENRMRVEISQAKRHAEHFTEQVEKGAKLQRLEENVLKKGGLWERYQRQIQQRSVVKESKKAKSAEVNQSDQFLHMIFDAK